MIRVRVKNNACIEIVTVRPRTRAAGHDTAIADGMEKEP